MANVFEKVKSFFSKAALVVLHALGTADGVVDKDAPEVEELLTEGASIADLIPGVGTGVASLLNAGVALVGAFQKGLDGTVAIVPEVEAQLAAAAPEGYSFVLIETDLKTDVEQLLAQYESEFEAAKSAVTTITGEAAPEKVVASKPLIRVAAPFAAPAAAQAAGIAPGHGGGTNLTQSPDGSPIGAEAKLAKPAPAGSESAQDAKPAS